MLASMSPSKGHSLSGYVYLLDFADAAANSSSTYGVEYSGKFDGFADKPFAVVAQGTSNNQQVVLGTISDIAERLKAMPLPSPALLMMGDVIKANGYAQQLADQTMASYPAVAQA
jgi:hypothetical protein